MRLLAAGEQLRLFGDPPGGETAEQHLLDHIEAVAERRRSPPWSTISTRL
jgi:hypothetical protein